jgi:hypothetical protein
MATEKQIAANRANAMRSTGPKTAAGRLKSSRNAFRHGLSGHLGFDVVTSAKIDAITHTLAGDKATEDQIASAAAFARAQVEVLRIRSIRTDMLDKVDLKDCNPRELRRVASLDRYERCALTKRRKASVKF